MKKMLFVALATALVWSLPALAASYEENVHYQQILPEPPQGKPGDKVEVVEFFMYSCPHCYNFEPALSEWLENKPEDVEFVRVPAMFGRHNNLHAQAYYALQAMGEGERLHGAFFEAIHEHKRDLKTREAIDEFVQSQGVDLEKFREAMGSFAVAAKTNRASSLLRRYGIRGVPSLVIDGRYKNGRGLGFKDMVDLADQLVQQVRQERREAVE